MRPVLLPLAVTLLLQMMISVLQMAVPVLAPILTAEAGVAPERIGNFASLIFVGSLWFLTVNGELMPRTGPLRLIQIGNLIAAAGLLLVVPGTWGWMLVAALLLGIGYGPTPPAGSQILARATPDRMRGLVFSLKQAGVPLAGAVTGLLAPWLALRFGWQLALVILAGGMLVAVLAVEPWRGRFDADRRPGHPVRLTALVSPRILVRPFRVLRLSPALIPVTWAGAAFAVVQGSVFSFLVTYLVGPVGLTLAAAGLAFSALQAVGVGGRIATGWFADRIGSGRRTLVLLSVLSAATAMLLAAVDSSWPVWAIVTVCGIAGLAVASWNGVHLAELANIAPRDRVGEVTAGCTFFTFIGYVVGPSAFGALIQWTGGYVVPFAAIAALVLSAGLVLTVTRGRWPSAQDEP